MTPDDHRGSVRAALAPDAVRSALVLRRPVFARPWESTIDMFACVLAVGAIDPFLLWGGGALMGSIFGFHSHWPIGVYMVAALVGAAGFMTIVGRERASVTVDILAIAAWLVLGVVVAPIIGLAPPVAAAIIIYAVVLAGIFAYVVVFGRWTTGFVETLSWPLTWSVLAVFFAFAAHHLVLYP